MYSRKPAVIQPPDLADAASLAVTLAIGDHGLSLNSSNPEPLDPSTTGYIGPDPLGVDPGGAY